MHACVLASTAFAANIDLLKSNNIKRLLRILFEQLRYDAVHLVAPLNIELRCTAAFDAFCPQSEYYCNNVQMHIIHAAIPGRGGAACQALLCLDVGGSRAAPALQALGGRSWSRKDTLVLADGWQVPSWQQVPAALTGLFLCSYACFMSVQMVPSCNYMVFPHFFPQPCTYMQVVSPRQAHVHPLAM